MQQPPSNRGRVARRRKVAIAGSLVAGSILLSALTVLLFSDSLLNRYIKPRIETRVAAAHPGLLLRITDMTYQWRSNRVTCSAVVLAARDSSWTCQISSVSLHRARWAGLLLGRNHLARTLRLSDLEATDIVLEFPQSHYGLRCQRLRASMPASNLVAEKLELRPLISDEAFFAAHAFRKARLHLTIPSFGVFGLDTLGLLRGNKLQANTIDIHNANLDALINRDKILDPHPGRQLMPHEALTYLPQNLAIKSCTATGRITFGARLTPGSDPGVLTFDEVQLGSEGISNFEGDALPLRIHGQCRFMNAGKLKVALEMPIRAPDLSLHYSGSLSGMDLTKLNSFLGVVAHARLKSGTLLEASFDSQVKAGHATGQLLALYHDLQLALLDRQTGSEKGLVNRVKSFLADHMALRNTNLPGKSGTIKVGVIDYVHDPEQKFLRFAWFAVRSGILDVLGLTNYVKETK